MTIEPTRGLSSDVGARPKANADAVPGADAEIDEIADRLTGDLLPFEENRSASEIVGNLVKGARAIFDAGRILWQAREHYRSVGGRGENSNGLSGFAEFSERRVGISYQTANMYVRIAENLAHANVSSDSPVWRQQGASKILAITSIAPADFKTLEEGGSVEGIGSLDDVARMTTAQAKNAVRQYKKDMNVAIEDNKKLRTVSSELAAEVIELRRKIVDGPSAPTPIGEEFAALMVRITTWCQSVKLRPQVEREGAWRDVVTQYDAISYTLRRALVPEKTKDLPLPDVDDPGIDVEGDGR